MDVVLGPGWPGILLHEAIGHGLEGDFNRKKTSAFAGRMGQRVADRGRHCGRRRHPPRPARIAQCRRRGHSTRSATVLIERRNPRRLHAGQTERAPDGPGAPTGNGRRESYAHLPMPRMTNTFMLAGRRRPRGNSAGCHARGLYAVSFGGGQVDITSGKFVFSASEAYKIEDGRHRTRRCAARR